MRKIAIMALPLFALSFGACGDDDNGKTDGSTHDMAVSTDGSKTDGATGTDGGSNFPAPPALGAQIDRMGRAGVADIGEVFAQQCVPRLFACHMSDHRPEDQIVMEVVAVLEEKDGPAGFQQAFRLRKQLRP